MLSPPKRTLAADTLAADTLAAGTLAAGTLATSGVVATAVADMVAHTVATSVRLTGLAAAFRCRCQLSVAGNPAARSR